MSCSAPASSYSATSEPWPEAAAHRAAAKLPRRASASPCRSRCRSCSANRDAMLPGAPSRTGGRARPPPRACLSSASAISPLRSRCPRRRSWPRLRKRDSDNHRRPNPRTPRRPLRRPRPRFRATTSRALPHPRRVRTAASHVLASPCLRPSSSTSCASASSTWPRSCHLRRHGRDATSQRNRNATNRPRHPRPDQEQHGPAAPRYPRFDVPLLPNPGPKPLDTHGKAAAAPYLLYRRRKTEASPCHLPDLADRSGQPHRLVLFVSGLRAVDVCLQGGVRLIFSLAWLPRIAPPELRCLLEACCHVLDSSKP